MTFVVDASALLDTLNADLPECSEELLGLLTEHDCVAPSLLSWEVGHVMCSRRAHLYGKTPADRAAKADDLLAGIVLEPPRPASRAATASLAQAYGLSFYDASYLELAGRLEVSAFVSHDEALLKAAKKELRGHAVVRRLDEVD